MKIDWLQVRQERLEELQKQLRQAVLRKDWNKVNTLRVEEKELKEKIKELG